MKRVLLTGMSGTGKSTLIQELRSRGFTAVDLDEPGWSICRADGEWVWDEHRVEELLAEDESELLFISGCAENQGKFYPQFDHIMLLSISPEVMVERLLTRTNNSYGKRPEELAEALDNLTTIEPLLRQGATHEVDTTVPIDHVLATVLSLVRAGTRGSECPRV